jgi:hypothetical protein
MHEGSPETKVKQHESYLRNQDQIKRRSRQSREENREWLESLKRKPCVDCSGKFHPIQMDFHHRDESTKLFPVGNAITKYGRERILEEITKCDLICANCHRLRHLDREVYR